MFASTFAHTNESAKPGYYKVGLDSGAGATLTAIPVVLFFLLVQRRIVFGLTAGAVRG